MKIVDGKSGKPTCSETCIIYGTPRPALGTPRHPTPRYSTAPFWRAAAVRRLGALCAQCPARLALLRLTPDIFRLRFWQFFSGVLLHVVSGVSLLEIERSRAEPQPRLGIFRASLLSELSTSPPLPLSMCSTELRDDDEKDNVKRDDMPAKTLLIYVCRHGQTD